MLLLLDAAVGVLELDIRREEEEEKDDGAKAFTPVKRVQATVATTPKKFLMLERYLEVLRQEYVWKGSCNARCVGCRFKLQGGTECTNVTVIDTSPSTPYRERKLATSCVARRMRRMR